VLAALRQQIAELEKPGIRSAMSSTEQQRLAVVRDGVAQIPPRMDCSFL
jgi:hypothetical protein